MTENNQLIRDLKLGITTGDYKVDIDIKNIPNKWYFIFNKKRKIIKYLFEKGAILTGSRALKCYKINNNFILNRNPNDWDFILSKNQFIQLCKDYNIYDFDLESNRYYLNKSFATFYDGYGGSTHLLPCKIQLIIQDELPQFIQKDSKKFASLTSIIESKIELSESCEREKERNKHKKDLNNIIVNTYFL